MSDTRHYFQSYQQYFWQWEDDGDVIAIPQESTIVYKDFVGDIIEKLSPQGLPPFGSLLLTLIATNPNGDSSLDTVYDIVCNALKTTDDVVIRNATDFLKLLTGLPNAYKQGKRRIMLFQVLFEGCHNILSIRNSAGIYAQYKNGVQDFGKISAKVNLDRSIIDSDFRPISLLSRKFDSIEAIIEKIAALPDLQQYEIAFEEAPGSEPSTTPDLIDELINNPKTFPVGSLVRWLWGGLNIPVHSTLPSQQPLGGISDLTNKGDLDKLLISEFANDDLFFLSRLANNEALYIHREIPPANNHLQRFVLIDATLKNWGTPKAIAFAVMLAIAKHPKTDIACTAFVLGTDNYYPVSVESIDTIIDALQIVEGGLHAAGSLAAFLKAHATDRNKEIFFITEPSTFRQAPLLKVMNEHHQSIHYQILTDADGNVDVYKRYRNSKKHVQHIRLPLENLWKKRHSAAPPAAAPQVFGPREFLVDYPILVRSTGNAKKILTAPDGEIFMLNNEKAVLRLFDKSAGIPNRGWDLLCQNLPFKTDTFEVGLSDRGEYVILLFNTPKREIFLLNLSTGENQTLVFKEWKSTRWPSFIFSSGKFLHYSDNKCWTISFGGMTYNDMIGYPQEFYQRDAAIQETNRKYAPGYTMFKNIRKVFINTLGELVFSKHTLQFAEGGKYIKLAPATDRVVKILANTSDYRIFTFPDGSTVEVNRSGLFILKSSDSSIEDMYIPSTLEFAVGIATPTVFAGNDYYYKGMFCEVILKDPGRNKVAAARVIKESLDCSLQECKYFIDHPRPVMLSSSFPKQKAEDFRIAMKEVGADVEIRRNTGTMAQRTTPKLIEIQVRRFIDTIINHGAQRYTRL